MTTPPVDHDTLPYKIAVLCYLYDADDRVLLLHRTKSPNQGMYSPIGGKLEVALGEGPHDCAKREIEEEAGLTLPDEDVRLAGIVSERAYEGETHWLIFLFEIMRPVRHDEISAMTIDEGTLEWVPIATVESLDIPDTDRRIMWPLVRRHRRGFFMVHIDCSDGELVWTVQEAVGADGTTAQRH
ncbi:MAG: NUDIX hydrolase [Planctomycetota bacterium]|jgi:8-oxo-dGTP diphosphatase